MNYKDAHHRLEPLKNLDLEATAPGRAGQMAQANLPQRSSALQAWKIKLSQQKVLEHKKNLTMRLIDSKGLFTRQHQNRKLIESRQASAQTGQVCLHYPSQLLLS